MFLDHQLLVIILHRVGFVLLCISAGVLMLLKKIFTYQDDQVFARKSMQILLIVARFGLVILVTTGMIRLTYYIPALILVKLLSVLLVIIQFFAWKISFDDINYLQKNVIRLLTILATAIIGLLI